MSASGVSRLTHPNTAIMESVNWIGHLFSLTYNIPNGLNYVTLHRGGEGEAALCQLASVRVCCRSVARRSVARRSVALIP